MAGNESQAFDFGFTVDHLKPVLDAVRHEPNSGLPEGAVRGEGSARLALSAFDPPPTRGLTHIIVDTIGRDGVVQEYPYLPSVTVAVTSPGWNDYDVRVRDFAGNESEPVRVSIFRDDYAPVAGEFPDIVDSPIGVRLVSESPTNRVAASIEISVSDLETGILAQRDDSLLSSQPSLMYRVGVDSVDGAVWLPVPRSVFEHALILPDVEDTYRIMVQVRDLVGRLWTVGPDGVDTAFVDVTLDRTVSPPQDVTGLIAAEFDGDVESFSSGSVVRLRPRTGSVCGPNVACQNENEACLDGRCTQSIRTISLVVAARDTQEAVTACLGACTGPDAIICQLAESAQPGILGCTLKDVPLDVVASNRFELSVVTADEAGNVSAPFVYSLRVDNTAPNIVLASHQPTAGLNAGFVSGRPEQNAEGPQGNQQRCVRAESDLQDGRTPLTTLDIVALDRGALSSELTRVHISYLPSDSACTINADCSGDRVCSEVSAGRRNCRQQCQTDADCKDGSLCFADFVRTNTRSVPSLHV